MIFHDRGNPVNKNVEGGRVGYLADTLIPD